MNGRYPVERVAGNTFKCYSDFKAAAANWYHPPYAYAVFGTDTVQAFEKAIAKAEGAPYALAFPSGMAAIASTLNALTQSGDRLILQDDIYVITTQFCDQILAQKNVKTETVATDNISDELDALFAQEKGGVLYLESPSYSKYSVLDLKTLIGKAKANDCTVVVDNSLATFLNVKPTELGADAVVYAASKHIAGHGDVLLGCVTASDEETYKKIRDFQILSGYTTSSDDAYLGLRGLETLEARMARQSQEVKKLATSVRALPWVESLRMAESLDFKYTPGLFSITLKDTLSDDQLERFSEQCDALKIGYGWGSTVSLLLPEQKDGKTVMRISVGMDSADTLFGELSQGYAAAVTKKSIAAKPATPGTP